MQLVDPTRVFAAGATGDLIYNLAWGDWTALNPELQRRLGYWQSLSNRGFWSRVLASLSVAGVPAIFQPYRQAGAEMIDAIDVPLEKSGVAGDLRLIVMGDLNGNPDPSQTFADVTVPFANLGQWETTVQMPFPILRKPGQTLWIGALTVGTHSLRAYTPFLGLGPSGALGGQPKQYYMGQWVTISNVREIAYRVHRASFGRNGTVRVPCQNLGLGGGIDTVDIIAPALIPEGNEIQHEVQIAGNPVLISEPAGAHPLLGTPNSLPYTIIMNYTDGTAPILDIAPIADGGAYARVSKAATSHVHVTVARTPGTTIDTVKESFLIDEWDGAAHTITPKLLSGGGFATETNPSSVQDEPVGAGKIKRKMTWTGLSITDHKVKLTIATSDPAKQCVVKQDDWSAEA